jgi:hypothetical protein
VEPGPYGPTPQGGSGRRPPGIAITKCDNPGTQTFARHELHLMASLETLQKGLSLAQENRMDEYAKFIHQIQVYQGGGKAGTSKDQQVFARLLFLFGNFTVDIFGDQLRILPFELL